jgi:hypothetical protein
MIAALGAGAGTLGCLGSGMRALEVDRVAAQGALRVGEIVCARTGQ